MSIYRFTVTAIVLLGLTVLPFVASRIAWAKPIDGNSNETKSSDAPSGRGVRSQPQTNVVVNHRLTMLAV